MASEPLIRGDWLQPGTHLDLIGAYTPAMREADTAVFERARVFVDARATTLHHIGEMMVPLAEGAITEGDVIADFYDIDSGAFVSEFAAHSEVDVTESYRERKR
jgi:ornithine cyclodeaminase